MEITKERLLEIANFSDRSLTDGRVISPNAYRPVTSIEITTMARMLIGYFKKEYKKQVDSNVKIYDVLDGWGNWVATGNSCIDWHQLVDKYRHVAPHANKSRRQCDNDEGRMIDTCMLKLKQYRTDDYELIIAHFVMGISLRNIAKLHGCSDGYIRKNLYAAIGFVHGYLINDK
ncbi:antiterminator Q family protein [Escherichia coli O8:H49]